MVPGTTHTGIKIVSEREKKIKYSKENDFEFIIDIPTFRRFKRSNPCGTYTLKKKQNSTIVMTNVQKIEPFN